MRPQDGDGDGVAKWDMGAYEYALPRAELLVKSIIPLPMHPRVGETTTLQITIKNTGSLDADDIHVDVYKHLDATPTIGQNGDQQWRVDHLGAGASLILTWETTFDAANNYHCYAQIDTANQILEYDEGNNILDIALTIAPFQPGQLQFVFPTYIVAENQGSLLVEVIRTGGSDGAVAVDYATSDGTARTVIPTIGCAPLETHFTNTSGGATNYLWNFGDGSTSTETNPVHVYSANGTYTVTLTASNAYGGNTKEELGLIRVITNPIASFIADPTFGCVPLTIQLTDTSANNPTSWEWDFGDGGTSSLQSPTHTFNHFGEYAVTLTVSNSCGVNSHSLNLTLSDTQAALVPDNNPLPTIRGECGLTLTPPTATDNCSGKITATTQDPLTYTTPGAYTVTWIYDDGQGQITTQTQRVKVGGQQRISLSAGWNLISFQVNRCYYEVSLQVFICWIWILD